MKAVLWISFLLFAASMAGIYYYYKNSYLPKQEAIAAQQRADQPEPPAVVTEPKPVVEAPPEKTEPVVAPVVEEPDPVPISVPKARVVSTGSQTIKSSIYKKPEEEKTLEEIAREKELAAMRKLLREAKKIANTEKVGRNQI